MRHPSPAGSRETRLGLGSSSPRPARSSTSVHAAPLLPCRTAYLSPRLVCPIRARAAETVLTRWPVLRSILQVPVVASGASATGRQLAAALAMGAQVQQTTYMGRLASAATPRPANTCELRCRAVVARGIGSRCFLYPPPLPPSLPACVPPGCPPATSRTRTCCPSHPALPRASRWPRAFSARKKRRFSAPSKNTWRTYLWTCLAALVPVWVAARGRVATWR